MNVGPHKELSQKIYTNLRQNLIQNIYKVYQNQNDIFENYSAFTGKGQGQHPFAGWTSLVVLIMAEIY